MATEKSDPDLERLLADKAEALEDLRHRKPGEKNYKRSLKAFLDADAKAQKVLLEKLDLELVKADRKAIAAEAESPVA
jgi:hypothetical protein